MSLNRADIMPPEQPAPPDQASPNLSAMRSGQVLPRPALTFRRFFLPIAGGLLLLAALAAAGSWWHFQAHHVVTRNALVRSHLSELGIRGEGVVAQVFVDAGDQVRQGDLLAVLEDGHLHARRRQVEAALRTLEERIAVSESGLLFAREQAQVDVLRAGAAHRQMQAEAVAARLHADDAKALHATRQALAANGAISAEVIRDAAARAAIGESLAHAADAAAAGSFSDLEAARIAEEQLVLREGELRVLKAERDELHAQMLRIDADLESSRVIAPADGAVIRRLAQPGMAVQTGMPLLSLWLTDDSWIEAWIPEEQVGHLHAGSEVSVSFPAVPEARFTGRVALIGMATDFEMPVDYLPQSRETRMRPTPQIGIQIRLEEHPDALRPGMSAVVDIRREGA